MTEPADLAKDWTDAEWLWTLATYPPDADVRLVDQAVRERRKQAEEDQ